MFDIIIIGAGPIGLSCGIEAEKRKLKYLIIEKGCLVNSIFNYPKNMTFFSTSERLEIGNVPFISHGPKPTRTEALEYYRRVTEFWKLKVNTYEEVLKINGEIKNFEILTNNSSYKTKYIILSTGFYDRPNFMNIPGEELAKVKHYYDEPYPYSFQKVVVVGGGNSAVDAALETYRKGAEVTMVVKKESLDNSVKYWVRPDIENRINENSIKAYFNSTLKEIKEKEVIVSTPDGEIKIENDFVLAMTGYQPNYSFMQKIGIEVSSSENREPVCNQENLETNVKGIFIAGTICGGMRTNKFIIENSRDHCERIFNYIEQQYLSH